MGAVSSKDYSGTPLAKKLGAKPGAEVLVFFTTRRAELLEKATADAPAEIAPAAAPDARGDEASAAENAP